jgi:hypothetical protein
VSYGQKSQGNYSRKKKPTFQAFINGKNRNLRVVSNDKFDRLIDVDEKMAIATRSKTTGRISGYGDAAKYLPNEVPKDWKLMMPQMIKEIKESKDLSPQTKDLIKNTFKRVAGYDLFESQSNGETSDGGI